MGKTKAFCLLVTGGVNDSSLPLSEKGSPPQVSDNIDTEQRYRRRRTDDI